jgi:hypothetical protein
MRIHARNLPALCLSCPLPAFAAETQPAAGSYPRCGRVTCFIPAAQPLAKPEF